jgi:hypothetical protein
MLNSWEKRYIHLHELKEEILYKYNHELIIVLLTEKSSSEGEKTFAVIIGLLAGVALLIIFLAFMRKVLGEPGK